MVSPLFSAFGPEPVRQRLAISEAAALVTSTALYRKKVAPIRAEVPALRTVLITDGLTETGEMYVDDLAAAMAVASPEFRIARTGPDDPALLHFTSGTTGKPKGALHVHGAVLAHRVTARYALDLRVGDIFWCTADPGWVTGMSYGVIAPLCLGATVISDEAEFDARRWYDVLTAQRVSVWYTAPTALRMLMRYGDRLPEGTDLSPLRFITSVGEPLNPEVVLWGERVLGHPVHDNWWQTETGAIMIANLAAAQVRPGSMGRPLPGVEATTLKRGQDGRAAVVADSVTPADPGEVGELALRPGWPSMFREYWGEPERYEKCFAGGWYLSGDLARRDADGYYWFVGRADDVIKSAGHLVGPFEVERADGAPRHRRGRCHRHTRSGRGGAGEGVRATASRLSGVGGTACRADRIRPQGPRRSGSQTNRVHRESAAHPQRQGDAPTAEGPRARPARRRYLDT